MLSRYTQQFDTAIHIAPDNHFRRFFVKIREDGTFQNYVAKSILGFFDVSGNRITLYLSITVCRCIVKSSPC